MGINSKQQKEKKKRNQLNDHEWPRMPRCVCVFVCVCMTRWGCQFNASRQLAAMSDFRSDVRDRAGAQDSTLSAQMAARVLTDSTVKTGRRSVTALLFGASFPPNGARRAERISRLPAKLAPDGGSVSARPLPRKRETQKKKTRAMMNSFEKK